MTPQKTAKPSIARTYDAVLQSFKKYPAIIIPFVTFLVFDLAALFTLYFFPRMPLIKLFGPPIRALRSERFLHYPLNFFLLPELSALARMCLSIIIGSLLTGMAVAIFYDIYTKKKTARLGQAFGVALKRYLHLFIVVGVFTILFYVLTKLIPRGLIYYFMKSGHRELLHIGPRLWLGPILLCIDFLLAIFIQAAFIYAIPILIIGKHNFLKAIWGSFVFFKRHFILTVFLITLPTLINVPIVILQQNLGFLVYRVFPESVVWLLVVEAAVSALLIDPLITLGAASLYLSEQKKD